MVTTSKPSATVTRPDPSPNAVVTLANFAKMLIVPMLLGAAGFLQASLVARVALFILVVLPFLAVAPYLAYGH